MTCGPLISPLPLPALRCTDFQPIHRRSKNACTGSKQLCSSFPSRNLVAARNSGTKHEARTETATLEPLLASNNSKDGALPPVLSTWRTALRDTVGSFREEPALLAITLVYLVQGLTDLAWLAEKYFLKDELHASPAQVAYFLSLASIPWMVKPLIGFVSDSFPLFGYRRRSYLLLASGAAAGSWLYMAVSPGGLATSLAAILVGSAAGAVSDVVVDSMVVERARDEDQGAAGSLQSLCWAAYAVGQIVTAALSGSMVEMRGPRFVFGVTAAFPLLIGLASLIVHEDRVEGPQPAGAIAPSSTTTTTSAATATLPADAGAPSGSTPHSQQLARQQPLAQQQHQQPSLAGALGTSARAAAAALSSRVATLSASAAAARAAASARGSAAWGAAAAQGGALWGALSAPAIAWPVAFLMLLSATPAADDAVFYFEVEALGFSPSFLGSVQLAIAVASLMGVWLYNAYFKTVPLRSFLLWGNLLGAALQCSDLLLVTRLNTRLLGGLDDHLFVLGGSVVTSVIANVLAMPTLVLAARLCPKGLEATMFATIMSLLNMADGVRYAGGAALMEALGVGSGSYANLPLLVGLCNAALLLPLPVLALVPGDLDCDSLLQGGEAAGGRAGAQGTAAGGQKVAEAATSADGSAEAGGMVFADLGLGAGGGGGADPWVDGAGGHMPVPVVMAARAEQVRVGAVGPLPAPAQPLGGPLVGAGGQGHERGRLAQQQQRPLLTGPQPPPALLPACSSASGAAPQPSAAVAATAVGSAAATPRGSRTAGGTAVPMPGPLGDDDRVDEGADGGAGEALAALGVPPAAPSGSRHSAAAAALLGGLQAFPSELRRGAVRGPRRVLPGSELDWAGGGAGGQRPGGDEGGWGLSE